MSWQGANTLHSRGRGGHSRRQNEPPSETVEAMVNRLRKSYALAMQCVGAFHRTDAAICASHRTTSDSVARDSMLRVGRAARRTFEQSILNDPLVDASSWTRTFQNGAVQNHPSVQLSSTRDKSTVQKLAYLSLVNYADLLIMGLPPPESGAANTILNRGLVKCLPSFRLNSAAKSYWTTGTIDEHDILEESEAATVRLALVAYVDATSLDASDPTVWLKLACAARRLSRSQDVPVTFGKYRRLERYALERAVSALPIRDPPNRVAVRALREWHKEEAVPVSAVPDELVLRKPPPMDVILELPRYSWSTLGRLLLRTCKDGSPYPDCVRNGAPVPGESPPVFFSPNVSIHISPLLVLPTTALARMISFLPPSHMWRLEATCRALSASVIAARVLLLDQGTERRRSIPVEESNPPPRVNSEVESDGVPSLHQNSDHSVVEPTASETNKRISKRLRSQVLTSGKRAERSARRLSVDFCLRAAIFGCTAEDPAYERMIRAYEEIHRNKFDALVSVKKASEFSNASSDKDDAILEYRSGASLRDFVADASLRTRTPLACLFRFVAHVSMHVAQTFSNDPAGAMGINSILLDCLELMRHRTNLKNELVVFWSQNCNESTWDSGLETFEFFSIDLLHAELRLRRCEMEDSADVYFDCDSNFVCLIIPYLLLSFEKIEQNVSSMRTESVEIWTSLKVRLFWLIASWHFWRGRNAFNVMDSHDAEVEGLKWIETAKKCFHSTSTVIPTPHLGSPARLGLHWKELSLVSMSTFADDIQASAVVLLAQKQFMDVARKFDNHDNALDQDDCDALFMIGGTLLQRYSCTSDNASSKFSEIIDDFFNVHGESFSNLCLSDTRSFDSTQNWFDNIVPSKLVESGQHHHFPRSPCILTILVTCLCTKPDQYRTIVLLLSDLVVTLLDLSEKLLSRKKLQWDRRLRPKGADDVSSSYDSDSDDNMSCSDEDSSTQKQSLNSDDSKILKYAALIRVLLTRILSFCIHSMSREDCFLFSQADVFESVLTRTHVFTSELFRFSRPLMNETDTADEDLGIFLAIQRLFRNLVPDNMTGSRCHLNLLRVYVDGLFSIVSVQRQILSDLSRTKPHKNGRTLRMKVTRKRADLVAAASFEAGYILSKNVGVAQAGLLERSDIFGDKESASRESTLAVYVDSLLWLWNASFDGCLNSNSDKKASEELYLSAYLDGFGRERLRVPIATAIIGLCGSASCTVSSTVDITSEILSLAEFYDSDVSTIDMMNNLDDSDECITTNKKCCLRVVVQAIHCVSHVFIHIDEKEACSYSYVESYTSKDGPGLPIVVTRVLNFFAETLLVQFKDKGVDDSESRWKDYPHGTKTTGALLDSMLWKAYKCLYGFTLTNETKDSVTCSGSNIQLSRHFLPESKEAAAMLYRCIMRAYSHGRRMPPKAALEVVLSAMPKKEDCGKILSIRNYLFSPTLREDEMNGLVSLASQNFDVENAYLRTVEFDWLTTLEENCDDETSRVRRGLSGIIAQGPIPRIQECGEDKDWRSCSMQSEEELSTKFDALIDDLCFGNTNDWEGWFKASQCLNLKSDLIADRLGLSRGFTRSQNFCVPERRFSAASNVMLVDLLGLQTNEQLKSIAGSVQSLGGDLSLYVRYFWSSLESLQQCFKEIGQSFDNGCKNDPKSSAWHQLWSLFESEDIYRWQHGLGGLFVSSLRIVAYRCLLVSLHLLNTVNVGDRDLLKSEIAESLGVSLYVELMGSQEYGFPMKVLTQCRKRNLAVAASLCFEQAIKLTQGEDDLSGRAETWDLLFMMGKCQEKIARTYDEEAFVSPTNGETDCPLRKYEFHMAKAIDAYAMSIAYANKVKKEGGFIAEHNGGSAHGVSEAVYRLHATRLKCLISAVDRPEDERALAELEVLRLTECHWFQDADDDIPNPSIRHRVWKVFVDVVGALAKLSLDNSYFHRSVYRHAQALLWAPVLYDPKSERSNGSFEAVPATLACKVRGLNYATSAAYSALSVISALFAKKRAQLVAVWVTAEGSTTTFQSINSSARKYDSLRGKYIAAYIECLRLCRRRKELDIFLTWTTSCPRDLPSHFAATAIGAISSQSVQLENLVLNNSSGTSFHFLTSVRRLANSALANVILEDMKESYLKEKTSSNVERSKFFETQLKLAYACFLRLNCEVGELSKSRSWKFQKQIGVKDVVDALTFAYANAFKDNAVSSPAKLSDWSGESLLNETLEAAVRKCKELYPSLSRNYSFARQRPQQKSKGMDASTSSKRKLSPSHEKRSFEVSIPEGLKEGDSFLTSVMVGETMKRVRLTVPSKEASSLRFSLQVPVVGSKPTTSSKAKSQSDALAGEESTLQ